MSTRPHSESDVLLREAADKMAGLQKGLKKLLGKENTDLLLLALATESLKEQLGRAGAAAMLRKSASVIEAEIQRDLSKN